jgi:bifunctional non-homologous end joining protein LigD
MLAVLSGGLPRELLRYAYEFKWDGVRAIAYWNGRELRLESRNLLDITHRYPELQALGEAIGERQAVLDGEIVALDEADRPSFGRLQQRMHVEDRQAIARLVRQVPAWYLIFDLLHLDGRSTLDLPYERRRQLLMELTLAGPSWRVPPAQVGEGRAMLEAARELALEGIVAKRLDSIYEPGRRSGAWLKIKLVMRDEFVIGGWIPEGGTNTSRVGALLLGYHQPRSDRLHYAGAVGSGFDQQWHEMLTELLKRRPRRTSPFAGPVNRPAPLYVEPELVAEVEYRRWPAGSHLQQAAFKGLRSDKDPAEVIPQRACEGRAD